MGNAKLTLQVQRTTLNTVHAWHDDNFFSVCPSSSFPEAGMNMHTYIS